MFRQNDIEEKPFIIAEVGQNHNGDLDLAREFIRIFAFEGASAIKFQTRNTAIAHEMRLVTLRNVPSMMSATAHAAAQALESTHALRQAASGTSRYSCGAVRLRQHDKDVHCTDLLKLC